MVLLKTTAVMSTAFCVLSAAAVLPSAGVQKKSIAKRWEQGVDCTSNIGDRESKDGLFFAISGDGTSVDCDDVPGIKTTESVEVLTHLLVKRLISKQWKYVLSQRERFGEPWPARRMSGRSSTEEEP
jgi:hypothetical protein